MNQTLTSGQRVRIQDSTPENPDPKGLVYYDFFRGLTGDVIKAYPDGTVAISIERKSLPEHIRERHEHTEIAERDKWLNGLSEDDRSKLSEREKKFKLGYTLLVSAKHVVPESAAVKRSDIAQASAKKTTEPTVAKPNAEPHRPTLDELAAKEAEYLESIKRSK